MMTTTKLLLLAGGKSSRMGSPKHLLPLPSGLSLYTRIAAALSAAFPGATVHMSLARDSIFDGRLEQNILKDRDLTIRADNRLNIPVKLIYDDENSSLSDIGPAAGLLAAHRTDPLATWIVAACDYPLVTEHAFSQLKQAHTSMSAVTCFRNAEGYLEPLLAVWSSEALERLNTNVKEGKLGPSYTVKELGGNTLQPAGDKEAEWLWNANTPEEWERCKAVLERWHEGDLA